MQNKPKNSEVRLGEAREILAEIDMPKGQLNDRTALTLLALADMVPDRHWHQTSNPLLGVTPIMEWVSRHYERSYAPNSRETFRRFSLHQLVSAGVAVYNPDSPSRPVNSPAAVYQLSPEAVVLLRAFDSLGWASALSDFLATKPGLATRYGAARTRASVPVIIPNGSSITLSPGAHSELIRAIVEEFGPTHIPEARLLYVGDTGNKVGYLDQPFLEELGVTVDRHGKLPDVVLYDTRRDWLVLIESVTSHGPVDGKRHEELKHLFAGSSKGLVFVTAFPDRKIMGKYLSEIAWESEVWVASAPSHLIHFNGDRFLGPYQS